MHQVFLGSVLQLTFIRHDAHEVVKASAIFNRCTLGIGTEASLIYSPICNGAWN